MRWKILCVVLLTMVLLGSVLLIQANSRIKQSEEIIDKYAAAELTRQDYVPGEFKKPDIPKAPAGTTGIVHAEGTVRYLPKSGAPGTIAATLPTGPEDGPPGGSAGSPQTPDVPRETSCSLDDLDVTLRCIVDALATPTRPWAKLTQSATISAWGQTRQLPWMPAGDVELQVAPSVVPPRWHLDLLSGVAAGERFGLEVGATWTGKSRLGPYLMVEWQPAEGGSSYSSDSYSYSSSGEPSTWRVHAGLRIRLK